MNIVLVCIDCVRRDLLPQFKECGIQYNLIPNLTRWLDDQQAQVIPAISNSSETPPSIASVFTGLLPSEHQTFALGLPTFPQSLSLIPWLPQQHRYGISLNPYVTEELGFNAGFTDWVGSREEIQTRCTDSAEGYLEFGHGKHINRIIRQTKLEEPFFLYAHFMDAHYPTNMDNSDKTNVQGFEDKHRQQVWLSYLSGIRGLDEQLHSFLTHIESKVKQHTIYIIFSDHGEALYTAPKYFYGHGWGVDWEMINVPVFVIGAEIRYSGYFQLCEILPFILNSKRDYGTERVISHQATSQIVAMQHSPGFVKLLGESQWISILEEDVKYMWQSEEGDISDSLYKIDSFAREVVKVNKDYSKYQDIISQHIVDTSIQSKCSNEQVEQRLKQFGYL